MLGPVSPRLGNGGGCAGVLFEKIARNSPEMASVCFFLKKKEFAPAYLSISPKNERPCQQPIYLSLKKVSAFGCLAGELRGSMVRMCAHWSRVLVTQCGICGASAQDLRLAICDLRFLLSLFGADSGACSPASSSSASSSSRVCLGRS